MARKTYYVVQPFEIHGDKLKAKQAVPATSAEQAQRVAERLAAAGGAVAFSRAGDPEIGEYDDAVLLGVYGQVPQELLDLAA